MRSQHPLVLSDDNYLSMALIHLFKDHQDKRYYFIDTDRVGSYADIYNFINCTPHDGVIIMILRGGIKSRPLERYGGLTIGESIENWFAVVHKLVQKKETRTEWLLTLSIYIHERNLTDRQRMIKFHFKSTSNVKLVAKKLSLSEKTVWTYLEIMYKKYNFSRFRDFVTFIRSN